MAPSDEQLGEYAPTSTAPRWSSTTRPSRTKWLAGAVAAAAIVWIGMANLTDTKPRHSPPAARESAPSAIPRVAPVSPLPAAFEYLLADQPALSSYQPRHGSRYNAVLGYFGPVHANITHNRPGEYLVDFPDLADPHDSVE